MEQKDQGFIQIYTGDGKGKTTAALGLALRAAGAGLSILILQFMKSTYPYSEYESLKLLESKITVGRFGNDTFVLEKRKPNDAEKAEILEGLELAKEAVKNRYFDLIILDEICITPYFGLIKTDDIFPLLDEKPEDVEMVLTGRYCPKEWIERANLVTEMREIKHYFNDGVLSRTGYDC